MRYFIFLFCLYCGCASLPFRSTSGTGSLRGNLTQDLSNHRGTLIDSLKLVRDFEVHLPEIGMHAKVDSLGWFLIQDIPIGEYELKIIVPSWGNKEFMASINQRIKIQEDTEQQISFRFHPYFALGNEYSYKYGRKKYGTLQGKIPDLIDDKALICKFFGSEYNYCNNLFGITHHVTSMCLGISKDKHSFYHHFEFRRGNNGSAFPTTMLPINFKTELIEGYYNISISIYLDDNGSEYGGDWIPMNLSIKNMQIKPNQVTHLPNIETLLDRATCINEGKLVPWRDNIDPEQTLDNYVCKITL